MLEVKNIKYSYNADYQALKGVSLKVEKGEMVALLGKNGAGKSTLFLHLNGIYEPDEGQVFIDATGDADLSFLAGVPMQPSHEGPLQPASTYYVLSGVDTDSELVRTAMHHNRQGVNCQSEPIRAKLLEIAEKEGIPSFGGPWFCTVLHDGVVTVNMTRTEVDACDNRAFSKAECELREQVFKMAAVLKKYFPEFKDSYVSAVAPQAGVRETRRIKGIHTITAEEYVSGYRYEDSISRGAHPIDIHASRGPSQGVTFLRQAAYVPYRALIAEDFSNYLASGRCISADREAFASLRVQASCMGTGQAAGVAAAHSVGKDVRSVDIAFLQNRLRSIGAII